MQIREKKGIRISDEWIMMRRWYLVYHGSREHIRFQGKNDGIYRVVRGMMQMIRPECWVTDLPSESPVTDRIENGKNKMMKIRREKQNAPAGT